ncbi:hypothetical protein KPL70_025574 [Citrus sinensis]|nr:hypothetical protein KPL70_025574 [Citrus sinensis]
MSLYVVPTLLVPWELAHSLSAQDLFRLRPVVSFILIDPLWWKNELILPISPGLKDSAITSKESSNRFSRAAHREHMGLDFIGHGVETLTTVKSVVLDAEEKQIHNHRLSDWLGKLKDACYDAEDVLDEFEVEDLRRQVMKQRSIGRKFRNFFGCSNPIAFRFRMGHQIKKIRERFDEIAKLRGEFNLIERLDDHRRVVHKERESTHSFVLSSDIIGRDKDREKIIELLMQASSGESETLSVIPIVGIGGLGKTALAQLVFNDQRVEEHFELKIWMRVFEDFGGRQIMREIMESIIVQIMRKCVFLGDLNTQQLQRILRDHLNSKRYLLVMDDVWNEDPEAWRKLKSLLLGGANGSKILVTTRSRKVASIMGTRGGTTGYNLQGLPFEDCLSLFMKCAFKEERDKHPNLIKIGEEIVKKCGGIPLAVRALGSLLCGKTDKRNWEYVRDIEIWQLEQMDTGILRALRLSYDQLPPHLKQCVAYCSIFPKGYQFYGDSLVQFWMAHGLLQSHNKKEELDDIGMRYLKELLSRFFFQDLSFGMLGMETFSFKMHDLMHDLALLVAKDEFLVVNSDCQFIPKKVRHLSFVAANASRNDFSSLLSDLGRVRTIFFSTDDDEKTSQSFIESCISKSQFLRVLDLSGSAIEVCPREMGNLKHTRYLDLSKNYKIKKLPKSICELQSLQTLNLAGCLELEELPKDIRYLVNLRLLALTTKQKSLQESGIRSLGSLRCLSISSCWNLEHLFEEIDQLSVLRTLSIESCPRLISLPPAIKYLSSLENLYLASCESLDLNLNMEMEGEGSHHDRKNTRPHIRRVFIKEITQLLELPQWLLQGSTDTLQNLLILGCPNFMALLESLRNFEALEVLVIGNCPKLSSLPEDMHHLTTLKSLAIAGCPALSERCKPPTVSTFGAVLDMVTDRPGLVFVSLPVLDIGSQWLQMYSTFLTGKTSHKDAKDSKNWLFKAYYGNRMFMGYCCVACEVVATAVQQGSPLSFLVALSLFAWAQSSKRLMSYREPLSATPTASFHAHLPSYSPAACRHSVFVVAPVKVLGSSYSSMYPDRGMGGSSYMGSGGSGSY